jgi:hypothetical protein
MKITDVKMPRTIYFDEIKEIQDQGLCRQSDPCQHNHMKLVLSSGEEIPIGLIGYEAAYLVRECKTAKLEGWMQHHFNQYKIPWWQYRLCTGDMTFRHRPCCILF